jgi:signal transduction histidine kinase
LLLATVAIFVALTATSLFVVRQAVRSEVRRQIVEATQSSVEDFERIQKKESSELEHSAALLSELPILKSLMTAPDSATIQDASAEFRDLSNTELLVLARPDGEVVAVHVAGSGLSRQSATMLLRSSMERRQEAGFWQDGTEIYLVVMRPIVAGTGAESNPLGYLVLGKRLDDNVARELANFAGTEVLLTAGNLVIASSQKFDASQLQSIYDQRPPGAEVRLGDRHYAVSSVSLPASSTTPIHCYLLLPLTEWDRFLSRLTQMIVALGAIAVFGAVVLMVLISRAITNPLDSLVAAVRALAEGNYQYAVQPRGSAEVAELGRAFNTMRRQLLESQRKQLEAERLAALGRAAGSISHDLRHQLAAVVANAEFLYNVDELHFDREEIYQEVRRGASEMTELIDSLVEIARDKPNLSPLPADFGKVVRKASDAVLALPELRNCRIDMDQQGSTSGVFDARKLERAFFNLLLNACEATHGDNRRVTVNIAGDNQHFECRVTDNGSGVPVSVRASLFEPFVSAGKSNGTGLGLAIARKIVEEHGGEIVLESTSTAGSTFVVRLPREAALPQTDSAPVTRSTST